MESKLSKQKILAEVQRLLSSEEGLVILLTGSLMISDFDQEDVAMKEALSAFNGNRTYFNSLIERSKKLV